nr:MAG TPA: hypothetical protein [Caudoviricetes sp.]
MVYLYTTIKLYKMQHDNIKLFKINKKTLYQV